MSFTDNTTGKTEWETPDCVFGPLNAEFDGLETDVCATNENRKCPFWYTKEQDGLAQEWHGTCWMNPPYGHEIPAWLKKASTSNALVVCLVPSRTDTRWWHEHVINKAKEIRFIKGRIKFVGAKYPAKFPSAIVIYDGRSK